MDTPFTVVLKCQQTNLGGQFKTFDNDRKEKMVYQLPNCLPTLEVYFQRCATQAAINLPVLLFLMKFGNEKPN